MRPDIKEDPTFLRYHEIFKNNPSSVVFAPLAELLIHYNCYEEAIDVCKRGLEKNVNMISGRIALAKAYAGIKDHNKAREEAKKVLEVIPDHPDALKMAAQADNDGDQTESENISLEPSHLNPVEDLRWNTVTMAEIFIAQGNYELAKKVYRNVLRKEPNNQIALKGIETLQKMT